jgi:diguanylate cyclase (GGDEF)-like protein/PAS domain S-box-containing protein
MGISRRWTIALLSTDTDANERLNAAADLDGGIVLIDISTAEEARNGVKEGAFDIVAATYPPRIEWTPALRICSEAGLCIWLAESNSVEEAYETAFDSYESLAVFAHAVLDHEDLTPTAIRRACVSAAYVKGLQQRLKESLEERARAVEKTRLAEFVIENSSIILFRWRPSAGSPVLYVSENVLAFGYTASEMTSRDFFYQSIIHPEDLEVNLRRLKGYRETDVDNFLLTYRILTREGEVRWIEDNTRVVKDDDGRVLYHQGIVIDVTQKQAAQEQLVKLSQAVEQSPGSVLIADTRGRIEYVNRKFVENSGFDDVEVVGRELIGFNLGGDSTARKALWNAIWQGDSWRSEVQKRRRDGGHYWELSRGSPIRNAKGNVTHYLEVGEDITEKKQAEAMIRQMAYYDALTKLPNRTLFHDRLGHALRRARREKEVLAVLFLDLDGFKSVNDTHGHSAGDELLRQVADRLSQSVRENDTVARMGGDEFMVLLPSLDETKHAGHVAEKIITAFQVPFSVADEERRVTASIGISTYPVDGESAEDLIKAADAAMYRSKENGRNQYTYFSTGPETATSIRRLTLHDMLTQAMLRDEFRLLFQPQVAVKTRTVVGADALLRWDHPVRGSLSPKEFMMLARGAGLQVAIDRWVLQNCARASSELAARGISIRLTAHVSDETLLKPDCVETAIDLIRSAGARCEDIEMEVEATSVVSGGDTVHLRLTKLRDAGIRVVLSGVAEGKLPLASVGNVPADALKLERETVRSLPDDRDGAATTRAILSLADGLGLEVVAQGVETRTQAGFLGASGCTIMQGFAFALPMQLDELATFISAPMRIPGDESVRMPRYVPEPE